MLSAGSGASHADMESWLHAPALLSATATTLTQNVDCHTRDSKTLDLLYANIKDAYSCTPLHPWAAAITVKQMSGHISGANGL